MRFSISTKAALAAIVQAIFLIGCAGSSGSKIRVGFPTVADAGDVPALMALDLLRRQGFQIEAIHFASPDLAAAALADGKVDIGNGSLRTYWAAIPKGARIRTLMEQTGNVWLLVMRTDLASCKDLTGARLAVNSAGSTSKALLDAYLAFNCPGVAPEILFLSGSDNRAAALQAGQIDGALLELSDVLELERHASKRLARQISFAQKFPHLKTTGVHVNRSFGENHPVWVREYLRAVLTVHRQIREDPASLKAGLIKYLAVDGARAGEIASVYLERNLWDLNGGLSRDDVQYSLEFFAVTGSLPGRPKADAVADLSYLNAVLQEIGRR